MTSAEYSTKMQRQFAKEKKLERELKKQKQMYFSSTLFLYKKPLIDELQQKLDVLYEQRNELTRQYLTAVQESQ
jgi:hypothetical protein